jgi:hypothetical protein
MQDPVLARVLASLDNADGDALVAIETDLLALRARLGRLAGTGLRTHESPYVAFARRLADRAAPAALAASA